MLDTFLLKKRSGLEKVSRRERKKRFQYGKGPRKEKIHRVKRSRGLLIFKPFCCMAIVAKI